jgi:hypothetical protein
MAQKHDMDLERLLIKTRVVETATTVTQYQVVKDGNADHEVQPCTDGVDAIGVIVSLGRLNGAAGDEVQMVYLAGAGVIPVKVGTGGATRGKLAKVVSDGVTSAAQSVTTPAGADIVGFFTQSGVAGDIVGMVPSRSWATE